MPGTLETRIQADAKAYRVTVDAMSGSTVRAAALAAGIDGSETTPLVTLREELVQIHRSAARAVAYKAPVTMSEPTKDGVASVGNPGNDNAALS